MANSVSGRFDAQTGALAARHFDGDTAAHLDDLPVIRALAKRAGGGPLLELGCGTGRALIPLARAGYSISGVDLSSAMLALARTKVEAAGLSDKVTLIEGDFANAPLGGPYRLAFSVMNTFLHLLSGTEQLAALRHWREALAPGGLLLLDVFAPDLTELSALNGNVEFDKEWIDPGTGVSVMKQVVRSVEQAEQIMHVKMIYDEVWPDGQMRRTIVPFDMRYIWRYEAELLLEKAGFTVDDIYGDWDLSPFDSASERLILVARRSS